MNFSQNFLEECKNTLDLLKEETQTIEDIVDILVELRNNKGRLFIIGSGGGAGHASHATCDFRKICNIETYAPYDNISELTARINDEGWNNSIVNYLKVSNFNEKDCIFVISVGGGNDDFFISMNLVNTIKYAKKIKSKIVGIVGRDGGYTKNFGDAVVIIPNVNNEHVTPITEGFQSIMWHLIVSHPKLQLNCTKW